MITEKAATEFIKLQRKIPTKQEVNKKSHEQYDAKSIYSKSVKLDDSKSNDSKTKYNDSKQKNFDFVSLTGSFGDKEDLPSCMTQLETSDVLSADLPTDGTPQDSDNDFGEVECGEPTVTRHLTFDFTISEDDTEFVQQKCCDFWDFIYSNPQLQKLRVLPESEEVDESQQEDVLSESFSSEYSRRSTPQATAIDILQKNDGTVPQAFAAKQPTICHRQECHSYCHGSCARLDKMMRKRQQEESPKTKSKKQLSTIDTQPQRRSSPSSLTNLCSELKAWDLEHPKTFDPPGRISSSYLTPKSSLQPLPSLVTPKELVCTSDVMCVPCTPSAEERLKLEKVDLEVRAEE